MKIVTVKLLTLHALARKGNSTLMLFSPQNTVDKMVSKANKSLKRGTSSWLQQFIDAVHMEEGELDFNIITF
jgi:hypothetical protein